MENFYKGDRLKLAILDMYNGTPNQGMRAIDEILREYGSQLDCKIFDVRGKAEVPGTDFDIYICSGGPGDPLETDGVWDRKFYGLLDDLWKINQSPAKSKKFVLFICHSFQMACHHFRIGKIIPRKSRSFGTFPCHKTTAGKSEPFFKGLPDPFCIADFRNFQVIQPDLKHIRQMGAKILAMEKIRPHVDLERALMAVRFSREMFGIQFHPEADPEGMIAHFEMEEQRHLVIKDHGVRKFYQMIKDLRDPDKIQLTRNTIIPAFLEDAISVLIGSQIPVEV